VLLSLLAAANATDFAAIWDAAVEPEPEPERLTVPTGCYRVRVERVRITDRSLVIDLRVLDGYMSGARARTLLPYNALLPKAKRECAQRVVRTLHALGVSDEEMQAVQSVDELPPLLEGRIAPTYLIEERHLSGASHNRIAPLGRKEHAE
jgi:hypothetical protein